MNRPLVTCVCLALAACGSLKDVGRAPDFTPVENGPEFFAMSRPGMAETGAPLSPTEQASLWSAGGHSLLGDRRASKQGDILTVVIEIDDKAEISNSTGRSRSSSEKFGLPSLFGIPQRLDAELPDGASMADAVDAKATSKYQGDGSVRRKEKLTLRIAATITNVMPNGVLHIQGSQEVRVNFEVRDLMVTGYVRPDDISRQNEITYDKIAGARISYGGRGQITAVQQPRYGEQVVDSLLPF